VWILRILPNTMSRSEREAYVKQWAAITISIFALILAVNGMFGGSNSSKVLNNTIQANNYWAWYQAKNVRATIYETSGASEKEAKQRADMEEISEKARAAEAARDLAKTRSPWFSYAGMALQLSIVLSSAAILAVMVQLLWVSVLVGGLGTSFMVYAMVI